MRSTFVTWSAMVLGLLQLLNGVFMLLAPELWYHSIPTVPGTGPFNPHFVRDIGAAYLVTGATFLWFAIDRDARPAAQAGAAFLALHALIHLWDAVAGREHVHQLLVDLPAVFLPPALAIWIAWPPRTHKLKGDTT